MTLVVERFIVCGGCGENFGVDIRQYSTPYIRKCARAFGWVFSEHNDWCPECKKSRKDPKK